MGETSGDEMVAAESSPGGVQIFRDSQTSKIFDLAKHKAQQIEEYETHIVKKYENLDLYRSKGLNFK
jgi:hypothetical protein